MDRHRLLTRISGCGQLVVLGLFVAWVTWEGPLPLIKVRWSPNLAVEARERAERELDLQLVKLTDADTYQYRVVVRPPRQHRRRGAERGRCRHVRHRPCTVPPRPRDGGHGARPCLARRLVPRQTKRPVLPGRVRPHPDRRLRVRTPGPPHPTVMQAIVERQRTAPASRSNCTTSPRLAASAASSGVASTRPRTAPRRTG